MGSVAPFRASQLAMSLTLLIAGLLAAALLKAEDSSTLIHYQGAIDDAQTGTPLDGSYSVVFSLYDSASGGLPVWSETQDVTVTQGNYRILLGSVVPFSVFHGGIDGLFSQPRWLGIRLASEGERTPRVRLVLGLPAAPGDGKSCPRDMVDLGDFCIDRHQNTIGMTWYGAADFCDAKSRRLCKIAEWMEACDGSPINGVEDMPGRQPQWVDPWVYETSTEVFTAAERGYFRCSSVSHPWSQYRPLERKWFRCCE